MNNKYVTIIIATIAIPIVYIIAILLWVVLNYTFSNSKLIRVPLIDYNVFIAKNIEDNGEILFNEYLRYMEERGYTYLPGKGLGDVWFKKNGKEYAFWYPKFKFLRRNKY